jgi:hypothetical protein
MVTHALVFAILSVHNTVHNQELMYGRWRAGGKIAGLPYHVNAPAAALAWVQNGLTLAVLADARGDLYTSAAMAVRGLGPAKATFSGGLLAFTHCPCIDVHMARKYGLPRQYANMAKYRAAVLSSPLSTTVQQWRAFETVPLFASGQHDVYFAAVLADTLTIPGGSMPAVTLPHMPAITAV